MHTLYNVHSFHRIIGDLSVPRPKHLNWLVNTGVRKTNASGHQIEIWELTQPNSAAVMSAWAAHFRRHYISDKDIPIVVKGTGLTNAAYLREMVLPDQVTRPGPSLRSGDFGEILVSDYIEYFLGFWCPQEFRYHERENRHDPTKGCDVIGFKFNTEGRASPEDVLLIFETKSGLSSSSKKNRLKDAITDSAKDESRLAMSLNAFKRKFVRSRDMDKVDRVTRFQEMADKPFRQINGAAAILDDVVFGKTNLKITDASAHYNAANLKLIVIKAPSMKALIDKLYNRAADEA